MPDPATAGGPGPGTTAPPDGGSSGQGGPDQGGGNLPPSGAPGAQPVRQIGLQALGRSFVAQAVKFLFMAIKALPPGEEFDMAHKVYSQLGKHFKVNGQDQGGQGGGGGQPQMPQAPGGGQPGVGQQPRGPVPSQMPAMPGMDGGQ